MRLQRVGEVLLSRVVVEGSCCKPCAEKVRAAKSGERFELCRACLELARHHAERSTQLVLEADEVAP